MSTEAFTCDLFPVVPVVSCYNRANTTVVANTNTSKLEMVGKSEGIKAFYKPDKWGDLKWHPGCGDIAWHYICTNELCGKPAFVKHACMRRECPDCYNNWVSNATANIVDRLLCPTCVDLPAHRNKRMVHFMLFPEEDREVFKNTKEEIKKIIDGYKYAKDHGVIGGVNIWHPFRTTAETKENARILNMKYWEYVRQYDNWREFVYLSKHMHLVCYVSWIKGQYYYTKYLKKLEEFVKENKGKKTNNPKKKWKELIKKKNLIRIIRPKAEREKRWKYKVVTTKDKEGTQHISELQNSAEDIVRVVDYLLTHTAVVKDENFDCIRWFGSCAARNFKTDKADGPEEVIEPPKCRLCGAELMEKWTWRYTFLDDIESGGMMRPKYMGEIENWMRGEPPPDNAKEFLV